MPFFGKKTDHNALISPLLLSVVFGLAAGGVGTLLVTASLPNPEPMLSIVRPVYRIPGASGDTMAPEQATAANPSALVFRAKDGASIVERAYVPAQALGSAMLLTSDGWLVSTDAVFTAAVRSALPSYRVVFDHVAYAVTDAVVDPFTGIVFLKIDGRNLPVTAFRGGLDLQAGSAVFGFDVGGSPRKFDVVGYDAVPAASSAELVRSSERLQRLLRLSGSGGAVPSGSVVVDASGEAVAIFLHDDAFGSVAVPFAVFSGQIGSVLRGQKTHRPYLGVKYVDLSRTLGAATVGMRPRGALVTAGTDGSLAVQRRSPADDAGILAGDRILAVNGEELGARTALADLIAEYAPGSVLTLTVRRGPDATPTDLAIQVTLGVAP